MDTDLTIPEPQCNVCLVLDDGQRLFTSKAILAKYSSVFKRKFFEEAEKRTLICKLYRRVRGYAEKPTEIPFEYCNVDELKTMLKFIPDVDALRNNLITGRHL